MDRLFSIRRPSGWVLALVGLMPALLAGCCTTCGEAGWPFKGKIDKRGPIERIDERANVPLGAIPAPLGTYVRAVTQTQAAKAEQDDFTIYLHEWFKGSADKLGPYGCYHLHQMIARLASVPFPIMIQPDPMDEPANIARRKFIIDQLAQAGVPEPFQRVIIAFPEPGGLYGEEIEPIYNNMLQGSNLFGNNGFNQFGFGGFGGFGRGFGSGFGGGFGNFGGGFGGFGPGFGF